MARIFADKTGGFYLSSLTTSVTRIALLNCVSITNSPSSNHKCKERQMESGEGWFEKAALKL